MMVIFFWTFIILSLIPCTPRASQSAAHLDVGPTTDAHLGAMPPVLGRFGWTPRLQNLGPIPDNLSPIIWSHNFNDFTPHHFFMFNSTAGHIRMIVGPLKSSVTQGPPTICCLGRVMSRGVHRTSPPQIVSTPLI